MDFLDFPFNLELKHVKCGVSFHNIKCAKGESGVAYVAECPNCKDTIAIGITFPDDVDVIVGDV